jgi:hypothetical protein
MSYATLTPYLTDYKTAKAARAAYDEGKDFVLNAFGDRYDGKPINKPQVEGAGYSVTLRFCQNRKTCTV